MLTHAHVKQNPKRTGVSMIKKKKKKLKENAAERPKGNGIMLKIGKCEDDKHNIF